MSITIDLSPEVESRLAHEAARNGIEKTKYAGRLIEEHLPPHVGAENGSSPQLTEKQRSAIALLQSWIEEDATDDPEEIRKAGEEWEEFKASINKYHESDRIIFP